MPSIHPSESPKLGWLVPCLAVADLEASGLDPDERPILFDTTPVERLYE